MSSRQYQVLFLTVVVAVLGIPASAAHTIHVRPSHCREANSATCGIQEAIDRLPARGGTVVLARGTYSLRQPIVLRSDVALRGSGASQTILTHGPGVSARLASDAHGGDRTLVVEDAERFRPGDAITVGDAFMHGWYAAHAVVSQVNHCELVLREPLFTPDTGESDETFSVGRNAVVTNHFPLIRAGEWDGATLQNITIEHLGIEGKAWEPQVRWRDFTNAAIHLTNVVGGVIRHVNVRKANLDGFSIQGGRDFRIEHCLAELNVGHGFHLGTGLRDSIVRHNRSIRNGLDGIFFCCFVTSVVVRENILNGNTGNGIGNLGTGCGGHDSFNVIQYNIVRRNGFAGIEAVGSRDNIIANNLCTDNSRQQPGKSSDILIADSVDTEVVDNHCGTTALKSTSKHAIEESGSSDHNLIARNSALGSTTGILVFGEDTQAFENTDEDRPAADCP
jgi:parallel beta-helix repeat protein